MSYRIYTTKGFILGSKTSGETSKSYFIYTEDFGLIWARAQGIRLIKSKLRFHVREYTPITLSLVKGREIWRITGSVSEDTNQAPVFVAMRARVFALTRRLVQGEEKNEILFETLSELFNTEFSELSSEEDILALETLVLVRVLSILGYLDLNKHLPENSFLSAKTNRKILIPLINKAIIESQL